jgi:phosphate/sulfate permease
VFIFFGLAMLFYLKGDKIQQIVEEKSSVTDVRPATIIDFVYGCIMIYFTVVSPIPMSTTWVFIGLLAGRELGMYFAGTSAQATLVNGLKIIGKDVLYAFLGLTISIIMASLVNHTIYEELKRMVGLQ